MVDRPIILHLKTQMNHVIELDLGWLWGPKMDCRKDHHALIAF